MTEYEIISLYENTPRAPNRPALPTITDKCGKHFVLHSIIAKHLGYGEYEYLVNYWRKRHLDGKDNKLIYQRHAHDFKDFEEVTCD